MHDRRTPTNLLDGRLWAGWGPPADDVSSRLVGVLARLTRLHKAQVKDILKHSRDRGRYILLEQLSRTKHAAVYMGVDRKLARKVAVKIHRDLRQNARIQATTESQAMAHLSKHPNIVQIHDFGEHVHEAGEGKHSTWLYSVLELCDCDLATWCMRPHEVNGQIRDRRDWSEILSRVIEAAFGLAYLHSMGLAHRDLKPTNILIAGRTAKLADFGAVAKPGPRTDLAGTTGFMPPDAQYGPSFAVDVFALAVTLWICLFEDLPYAVPSGPDVTAEIAVNAAMQRCLDREISPPRIIPPGQPESVRRFLERALDPDPKQRPSLDEFIYDLQTVVDQVERRKNLRRWAPLVAGGVIMSLGTGFFIGAARSRGSGAGSLPDAALGAFDPLTRAEYAAIVMGDGETAIEEIGHMFPAAFDMSSAELERVADRVTQIADSLELHSPSHAREARRFAEGFRELMQRNR